jgi:hypothetical protein
MVSYPQKLPRPAASHAEERSVARPDRGSLGLPSLIEDRKVERLAIPEPDRVFAMISPIIAGRGMGKDGQASAIHGKPGRDLAEAVSRHGHLDASARVRANGTRMEMPDGHVETLLDRCRKGMRGRQLVGIEIYMRVKIVDGHEWLRLSAISVVAGTVQGVTSL